LKCQTHAHHGTVFYEIYRPDLLFKAGFEQLVPSATKKMASSRNAVHNLQNSRHLWLYDEAVLGSTLQQRVIVIELS
jgi:hypothetical protein